MDNKVLFVDIVGSAPKSLAIHGYQFKQGDKIRWEGRVEDAFVFFLTRVGTSIEERLPVRQTKAINNSRNTIEEVIHKMKILMKLRFESRS